jgi:hypothetical protein
MGLPPSSPRSPGSGASSRPARSTSAAEIISPSSDASLGGFERHSASSCDAERCKNSRYPASRACCCPRCAASSFRTTALLRCCRKCAAHAHISAGQSLQAEHAMSTASINGPHWPYTTHKAAVIGYNRKSVLTCVIGAGFRRARLSWRGFGWCRLLGPHIQCWLLRCCIVPPHIHLCKHKQHQCMGIHRLCIGSACMVDTP